MSITVMKLALDVLEEAHPKPYNESVISHVEAITALRTAIEQAESVEPVAYVSGYYNGRCVLLPTDPARIFRSSTAFYTTPPAAQRQPLTDEAIWRQYQALWPFHPAEEPRLAADMVTFARAIEAAHGIKENT